MLPKFSKEPPVWKDYNTKSNYSFNYMA
jgi:hypothetical protein